MRKRDLHILTSDIYTYTGDQRFSVIHPVDTDEWNLKIEYAQQRDSGIYECQVNTEPKINLAVNLDVTGKTELLALLQRDRGAHKAFSCSAVMQLSIVFIVSLSRIYPLTCIHVKSFMYTTVTDCKFENWIEFCPFVSKFR